MRTSWTPTLPPGDGSLFVRIADAVSADIRRGVLAAGARLPGSRTLARQLGVDRTTVVRAYAELEAQGWVRSVPQRGTFVAVDAPYSSPLAKVVGRQGFDLPPPPAWLPTAETPPRGVLVMQGGVPDLRLTPLGAWGRALRRAAVDWGTTALAYGDPRGVLRARQALSVFLAERRGLAIDPEQLVITRGAQAALYLIARAVLPAGALVAVEELGYAPAWSALRACGHRLVATRVDAGGLDVDALIDGPPVDAVYLTPHHQYPTGATLDAGRRQRLLRWAAAERVLLIEDDYDHEFHYASTPVRPLAANDTAGVVAYVGTLSKAFAPGLRFGWLAAPPDAVARIAAVRSIVDRQGDPVGEHAVADLLRDGELVRHLRRVQRIYARRQGLLSRALGRALGDVLAFRVPSGGLALWSTARGVDVEAWRARALARGVAVDVGRRYRLDGAPLAALRLGFAALDEAEILEAVRRLAAAR